MLNTRAGCIRRHLRNLSPRRPGTRDLCTPIFTPRWFCLRRNVFRGPQISSFVGFRSCILPFLQRTLCHYREAVAFKSAPYQPAVFFKLQYSLPRRRRLSFPLTFWYPSLKVHGITSEKNTFSSLCESEILIIILLSTAIFQKSSPAYRDSVCNLTNCSVFPTRHDPSVWFIFWNLSLCNFLQPRFCFLLLTSRCSPQLCRLLTFQDETFHLNCLLQT
jgi:hypothetical protein